jgi:hypothetical protein
METKTKALKSFISFFKIIIFSNFFVSLCVTALTHSTYLIYNLPKENIAPILTMVFCFSFLTYNLQRFIKFNSILKNPSKTGNRLQWINNQKTPLITLSILSGIIGIVCTYFIQLTSFIVLIPMGFLSFFYVIPIIPFYKKSPTLREVPYIKILIIGTVWSLITIGLPVLNTTLHNSIDYSMALSQVFLFTVAITLPFDIRDINYDENSNLKTIPRLLGIKKTIISSQIFLTISIALIYISDISTNHFYGLLVGHIITMVIISFSNKKRKELFYAGLVEGTVIILYSCLLISEYFFSL